MPDPATVLSTSLQVSLLEGLLDGPIVSLLWTPGSGVAAFVATLVAGAVACSVSPEYTAARVADLREEPGLAFVSGFFSLVLLVVVSRVLVATGIGIAVAIPLLICTYVLWAVGSAIAFTTLAHRVVGREDGRGDGVWIDGGGWRKPLLLGAGVNGLLSVAGVGGLLSLLVGAVGVGAVVREPP